MACFKRLPVTFTIEASAYRSDTAAVCEAKRSGMDLGALQSFKHEVESCL